MKAVEDGNVEVINLWEGGDGMQDLQLYKRPAERVLSELLADARLAGCQHFALKEYKDAKGGIILFFDDNDSVTFQLAQILVEPGTAMISIVLYIDATTIKWGFQSVMSCTTDMPGGLWHACLSWRNPPARISTLIGLAFPVSSALYPASWPQGPGPYYYGCHCICSGDKYHCLWGAGDITGTCWA